MCVVWGYLYVDVGVEYFFVCVVVYVDVYGLGIVGCCFDCWCFWGGCGVYGVDCFG